MGYKITIEERIMKHINAHNEYTDFSNLDTTYLWPEIDQCSICGMCGDDWDKKGRIARVKHINKHKLKYCQNCGRMSTKISNNLCLNKGYYCCYKLPFLIYNVEL